MCSIRTVQKSVERKFSGGTPDLLHEKSWRRALISVREPLGDSDTCQRLTACSHTAPQESSDFALSPGIQTLPYLEAAWALLLVRLSHQNCP
jgi:hypothetical protein